MLQKSNKKKPNKQAPKKESDARDLVPVGRRDIAKTHRNTKRDERGHLPTTSRALVLRNGKHGAMGQGELQLSRMTGREKLDLLADDLVDQTKRAVEEQTQKAVMSPFNLEHCMRIAEAQFNAYLDDIGCLKDPEVFHSMIDAEIKSRTPKKKFDKVETDPRRKPSYVASMISTRIHNAYMLAAAWKVTVDLLNSLNVDGLNDRTAQMQLRTHEKLRSDFLALYDMVNILVETGQKKLSVLAMTAPHYEIYFKPIKNSKDPENPEIVFDWDGLRAACKSFVDNIIIELCFPRETYPKAILLQILHDAVDELPREAKRFPQAMWDAVGDLAVTVELQTFLERLLIGPEGEEMKSLPRHMPEQYEDWVDAQLFSERAADRSDTFKDIVLPIGKSKTRRGLDNIWNAVNANYKEESNKDVDALWGLTAALNRKPHWHSTYQQYKKEHPEDPEDPETGPNALVKRDGKGGPPEPKKKPLAITAGGEESDDSMPELQSVSDSSDEDEAEEESSDEDEDEDSDEESDYNTDEEDMQRDFWREAMDMAAGVEDFYNPKVPMPAEFDEMAQDRQGNPFIKLLGSLRGRMFSGSSKLKTAPRDAPRKGFAKKATKKAAPKDGAAAGGAGAGSRKATVEEASDDEDGAPSAAKKKKKKKPKKKKKKTGAGGGDNPILEEVEGEGEGEDEDEPAPAPPPSATPTPAATPAPATPPKKKAPAPKQSPTLSRTGSIGTTAAASTASLPLPAEQQAQSARSYLQKSAPEPPKTKVKSRPDPSMQPIPEKEKTGFFSRWTKEKSKPTKEEEDLAKKGKRSWFSRLSKKTNTYMHQLLGTAEDDSRGSKPMKWENFLKLMREMGFEYDPSTAGSSVRFDPPNKADPSITFHKPHPDPTLYPVLLKEFSKKLQNTYGWTEEDFLRQSR